jgi:DNA-binding winged helix-turn-helix (wHTH) protein
MNVSTAICISKGLHCISCIRATKISERLGGDVEKDTALYKLKMSERHFKCLCLLFENKGVVKSKDQITKHVWNDSIVGPSSLGVLICELRALLSALDISIITVRGKGYVLVDRIEGK